MNAKLTPFFIPMLLMLTGCIKSDDYVLSKSLDPNDIIKFVTVSPIKVLADSSSEITIKIQINPEATTNWPVTFKTDKGLFSNGSNTITQPVNLTRNAQVTLKAGLVAGPVRLQAIVQDTISIDTFIVFDHSYPDSLFINSSTQNVAINSSLNCQIDFFKFKGYPSSRQLFRLHALDSAGNIAGEFQTQGNFTPGSKLAATYTPFNDFAGKANLRIVLYKENGDSLSRLFKVMVR
jgi:hypothetical protein